MSRKKTILVVSLFCLVAALLVTGLWINPQSKAGVEPRKYIWGYVTYEAPGNRHEDDQAVLYDYQKQNQLNWVLIKEWGSKYGYKYLFPPSMPEGDYWVRGEGLYANSGFYFVHFDPDIDIRVDIYMSPKEPDK